MVQKSLTVRVNALLCLSDLIHLLDKHAVLEILQTLQRCTAVDHSAPTLMCTLGVANSIHKLYGVEFVAEHVLPLLVPLLTAQQLNVQQFAKYMLFVKDMLRKIEEKRGVTVTESGASEVKLTPLVANGAPSDPFQKTSGTASSSIKRTPSWDEDWVSTAKGSSIAVRPMDGNLPSSQKFPISQPTSINALQSQPSTSASIQQTALSCPAVDIEWPPTSSSTAGPLTADGEKQNLNSVGPSNTSFDDIDPFANWPPRPNNSLGGSGSANNGIGPSTQKYGNSGLNMSSQNGIGSTNNSAPIGLPKQYQAVPMSTANNLNGMGFISNASAGISGQNQGSAAAGVGNSYASSAFYPDKRATDLGSIFVSSKNQQATPKLAPPPPTATGRGRGRTQGHSASRPSHPKAPSEQPPLLDLL